MVSSMAEFIEKHLYSGGTRSKEAQAAYKLLLTAASSEQLVEERKLAEAARRLRVRAATFRILLDERLKMDAELEDGVEVGRRAPREHAHGDQRPSRSARTPPRLHGPLTAFKAFAGRLAAQGVTHQAA
jgi:hypothetical protein